MRNAQAIYKYPIGMGQGVQIAMPAVADIKAVGIDGDGVPCIWALVDPDAAPSQRRTFGIYGTGDTVSGHYVWIGTFFTLPYVWHVFEETRP